MLKECIECNYPVSPKAKQCPNCKTHNITGVACLVCDEDVKRQEAQTTLFGSVCSRCIAKLKALQHQCPVCEVVNDDGCKSCSSCGHPFKNVACSHCGLSLLEDFAVTVVDKSKPKGYGYKDKYFYQSSQPRILYFHKECSENIATSEELPNEAETQALSRGVKVGAVLGLVAFVGTLFTLGMIPLSKQTNELPNVKVNQPSKESGNNLVFKSSQ